MVDLTKVQQQILDTNGHLLVTGGPGSGKTTVSILKAAKIAREHLRLGQTILFLSFARATVSRVLEAIDEERQIASEEKRRIEVDTYHSFFWRILKAHGYLVGFPRKMTILTPPNEAIALSAVRSGFKANAKLTDIEKAVKRQREDDERLRLARDEGKICFDLFAAQVGTLLHRSAKIRKLVSTKYPFIILDEFQDTSADQWRVVKALGQNSTLIALADPEQRIFDFIGADPARLDHFKIAFAPTTHDLSTDNHRSKGTDIAAFGNDILTGKFRQDTYLGIDFQGFESNPNQAFSTLTTQILQARARLIKTGKKNWSLAILVPTKKMTRLVSDALREPHGTLPAISHSAAVDMEGPILAAEVVAFLLQPRRGERHFGEFVDLLCSFFHGKGGNAPSKSNMDEANRLRIAFQKWTLCLTAGKPIPGRSVLIAVQAVYSQACAAVLIGDPDVDWIAIRSILEQGGCSRLKEIAVEVRNVRLLERGTQLRQALAQDWRENAAYQNALAVTRQSFVQEHFATGHKPERGVVVMNMHKAKGKQFDEVIIFEGWPRRAKREIVANPDRIVQSNSQVNRSSQARQNFRVSITRAKTRTTILSPNDDICVLLLSDE
ncbi:MAG: ATP-dependent helicase [Afipia sp.]|uniref:DNA helicase-2/ATP-dependent DNA helicase PcrA n=1 Tax=Afipia massiliensis TaxID=211460 RepID=A0A840N751_9BRAD|nr:UvrD-helicase domain-containing protein [Afipia massiliensis]MAH71188.1 ATP-dependent helicase [Afipia sp.]OUX59712.1 MAG: AAA family ATPase [Afipia sp. TMED4]MBB5053658.1 DNA helicase-2/ATP-dependent DNA helicase PcrA [Afipia massiliensis]HAQ93701.1 ATP-dependent helicase [Afipia sp.]HCX16615.1 ATP-dependent helicase [Afipia sp.]